MPVTSGFHEYFTASVDGGVTFLPAVRVSSEPSGNLRLTPGDFRTADVWRVSLLSAESRWGNGGDYMGLTADAAGAFHPFWADSRSGTFQIYTAVVHVPLTAKNPAGGPSPAKPVRERVKADLRSRVALVYDPTRYDADSRIVEMPARRQPSSGVPPPCRRLEPEIASIRSPSVELARP